MSGSEQVVRGNVTTYHGVAVWTLLLLMNRTDVRLQCATVNTFVKREV